MLVTDSGGVIGHDDINLFSRNPVRKIFTSHCNCVAIAMSGNIFTSDDDAQDVADIFAKYLKDTGKLSSIDDNLQKELSDAMFKHASFFSFILMTSINKSIYTIESDFESKTLKIKISQLRSDELYVIGSGFLYAHTAIVAGCDPIEAVKFAIKSDSVSRAPVMYIEMDELSEYQPGELDKLIEVRDELITDTVNESRMSRIIIDSPSIRYGETDHCTICGINGCETSLDFAVIDYDAGSLENAEKIAVAYGRGAKVIASPLVSTSKFKVVLLFCDKHKSVITKLMNRLGSDVEYNAKAIQQLVGISDQIGRDGE